ncbi:hypothetical protein [Halostagnicola bangensis]
MRRRDCLATFGIGTVAALAGCTSDTDNGDENGDNDSPNNSSNESSEEGASLPEQPTITTEDTNPDRATTTLEIEWNATVFDTYQSDPETDQFHRPPEGEQHLVIQKEITNTGEETANFVPRQMNVAVGGTEADWTVIDDVSKLDVDLEPEESVNEWTAFAVPENPSEVAITIQEVVSVDYAATFTHDENLEVEVVPAE